MVTIPRHQCLVYSGAPSLQLNAIGERLMDRLKAGHRCMYLNSPTMVTGMRSWLAAAGVNITEETKRGALALSSEQDHLVDGRFEIDPMIKMIRDAVSSAEASGFSGLWATGDMTWEFGSEKNMPKLLEYECKLEELFRETPGLSGICQYHMDTISCGYIQQALYAHEGVFFNETLTKLNPYYVEPRILANRPLDTSEPELQRMLHGLGLSPHPKKSGFTSHN